MATDLRSYRVTYKPTNKVVIVHNAATQARALRVVTSADYECAALSASEAIDMMLEKVPVLDARKAPADDQED